MHAFLYSSNAAKIITYAAFVNKSPSHPCSYKPSSSFNKLSQAFNYQSSIHLRTSFLYSSVSPADQIIKPKQTTSAILFDHLEKLYSTISFEGSLDQSFKSHLSNVAEEIQIEYQSTESLIQIYDLIDKFERKGVKFAFKKVIAKIRDRVISQIQQLPQRNFNHFNLSQLMTLYQISALSTQDYLRLLVMDLILKQLRQQKVQIRNIQQFFTAIKKVPLLQTTEKGIRSSFLQLIVANTSILPLQNLVNIAIQLNQTDHYEFTQSELTNVASIFQQLRLNAKGQLNKSMIYQIFDGNIIYWNKSNLFPVYNEIIVEVIRSKSSEMSKQMTSFDLLKVIGLYAQKVYKKEGQEVISNAQAFSIIALFFRQNNKKKMVLDESQSSIVKMIRAHFFTLEDIEVLYNSHLRGVHIGVELSFQIYFIKEVNFLNKIHNEVLALSLQFKPKDLSFDNLIKLSIIVAQAKKNKWASQKHTEIPLLEKTINQQLYLHFNNQRKHGYDIEIPSFLNQKRLKKFNLSGIDNFVKLIPQQPMNPAENSYHQRFFQYLLLLNVKGNIYFAPLIKKNPEAFAMVENLLKKHLALLKIDSNFLRSQIKRLCLQIFPYAVESKNYQVLQCIFDILILYQKYRGRHKFFKHFQNQAQMLTLLKMSSKHYAFFKQQGLDKKFADLIKLALNIDVPFYSNSIRYNAFVQELISDLKPQVLLHSTLYITIIKHALRMHYRNPAMYEGISQDNPCFTTLERQKLKLIKNKNYMVKCELNKQNFGRIILSDKNFKLDGQDKMQKVRQIIKQSSKLQICQFIDLYCLSSEKIYKALFKTIYEQPQLLLNINLRTLMVKIQEYKWYNFAQQFFTNQKLIASLIRTHLSLSQDCNTISNKFIIRYYPVQHQFVSSVLKLHLQTHQSYGLSILCHFSITNYQFNQNQIYTIKKYFVKILKKQLNISKFFIRLHELQETYFYLQDYMTDQIRKILIDQLKNAERIKLDSTFYYYLKLRYPEETKELSLNIPIYTYRFQVSEMNSPQIVLIKAISLKVQNRIIQPKSPYFHLDTPIFQINNTLILSIRPHHSRKKAFLQKFIKLCLDDTFDFLWINANLKDPQEIIDFLKENVDSAIVDDLSAQDLMAKPKRRGISAEKRQNFQGFKIENQNNQMITQTDGASQITLSKNKKYMKHELTKRAKRKSLFKRK